MKSINLYINEKLMLNNQSKLNLYGAYAKVMKMISNVIPISRKEDEKEYEAVESWILKNNVKNINIVMSNDAFSQLCPDCEEEFKYIKEFDYVDVNDSKANILEKYISNYCDPKYIYKTYRDNGWLAWNDKTYHILIYKMDFDCHIFIYL